jgi:hypothetical protein
MMEGIDQRYETIASSIRESISEAWKNATMEAVFYPNAIQYTGEYTRASDGVARSFATDRRSQRAFREIRQLFKEAAKPLWGRAIFELTSDGKFNMTWVYEGCDKEGNAIFDEEIEAQKHEERHRRLTS